MGRRIGQVAGVLAFALMIGRLSRLLESGPLQPNWQMILAAAAFLGGVAWWLLGQVTNNTAIRVTIFTLAGLLLSLRIIAPETLSYGFLPGAETLDALDQEMGLAFRTIRSGVPPVLPTPGLLAVLSLVMWSVGALFAWGSTTGPYAALFTPSLVMYLQFAVYDRKDVLIYWLAGTAIVLSLGIVSLALERRGESGRARNSDGRPVARRTAGVATITVVLLSIGAIAVADTARQLVSEYGNLPWRSDSGGFGGGPGGGIRFDGLVGLQQRVINRSNEPVFTARVSGDLPDSGLYWRMQTLDRFEDDEWRPSGSGSRHYQVGQPLASQDDVYQGTTYDLLQRIEINNLVTDIAPTLGVPLEIQNAPDTTALRHPSEFNMFTSAEIAILSGLDEGDQYQVLTRLGDRTADLGILATNEDGELSTIFAEANERGVFPYSPDLVSDTAVAPPDIDRFVDLPRSTPAGIAQEARRITRGATTDFEAAWMLQAWFRDSGEFTYSTDVSTGHGSLVLDEWLTNPDSENYRTGYCEQFAASMGVMLRTLDIPSRVVWGFTPGTATDLGDGTTEIVVRDTNAHAWVEVFLEPYGWFAFDPTPRGEFQSPSITAAFDPQAMVPEVERPDGSDIQTPGGNFGGELLLGDPDEAPVTTGGSFNWLIVLIALVPIAVAAIPGYKWFRRRRRLARIKDGDITAAWDEIVDRLTDLGEEVPASLTPMELAYSKDQALVPLARSYSAAVYGDHDGRAKESDLVGVEWWINREYESTQRLAGRFSWRSLLR